jgi:ribonuclease G
MSKQILVNASHYETRVATLENGEIKSLHIEREEDRNVVGNVYKGLVKRVLPGMQAAFLELGLERTAFLYVDDIVEEPLGSDVEYDDDMDDEDDSREDSGDDDPDSDQEGGGRGHEPEGRGRRPPPKRGRFQSRRHKGSANIQDLLKEGQEILVQVAKAPIGTKGARLTTHISLPGRNLVLMPTVKHIGISRRIESERERRRLRDIFTKRIRPKEVGFIIRTVAEGATLRDLKADSDYLIKLWARIRRDAKRRKAPALIHEDLSLSMRSVRDFFTDEVDSFVIDDTVEYERVLKFIGQFMPRLKSRVKLFRGPSQLFEHYGIEAEISRALGKKVWLKSGGYLLVDQSEALTAIDVNTGRYVGSKSLEETILKTNLEAVKEIAYQLRIRNVGGIIIIDLIDMESAENREKVFSALQDALGEDKAKTNILKISELGLVEMTRKRTHEDLVRYLTESCAYCDGRGYHKSRRTVSFEIFREIEKEALSNTKNIVVFAHPQVVSRLLKEEKDHVLKLQDRFGKLISIKPDPVFHIEQFEVFGKH